MRHPRRHRGPPADTDRPRDGEVLLPRVTQSTCSSAEQVLPLQGWAYASGAAQGGPQAIQLADRTYHWQDFGRPRGTTSFAHCGCLVESKGLSIYPKARSRASTGPPIGRPSSQRFDVGANVAPPRRWFSLPEQAARRATKHAGQSEFLNEIQPVPATTILARARYTRQPQAVRGIAET